MASDSGSITAALQGKICLVTGGSRTLGSAIVRRMAYYGAQVVINYLHAKAEAQALCDELEAAGGVAHAVQADVGNADDVARLMETIVARFGKLDVLVNNVGPYVDTPLLNLPLADFDQIVTGNVRANFLLSQAFGRLMKQRGSGKIINIAATDIFHRSHSIYGLAKSAVVYLTEALALELAPEVQIYALAPDLIAENEDMSAAVALRAVAATPMGRLITRPEIAEMACLLCTPAFTMATGHLIVLDGARSVPRIAIGPDIGESER